MASIVEKRVKLTSGSKRSAQTVEQVLADVTSGAITAAQAAERIAAIKAPSKGLEVGQSPTGAVCVYGLSAKFPVSLYDTQWQRLREVIEEVCKFCDDNPITEAHKAVQADRAKERKSAVKK